MPMRPHGDRPETEEVGPVAVLEVRPTAGDRGPMTKRPANRVNRTGRTVGNGRYVAMTHWMMRTAAWQSLDCVARCAYLELASRYAGPGSNNGRLPFSLREWPRR
jgi:hypothetical protein